MNPRKAASAQHPSPSSTPVIFFSTFLFSMRSQNLFCLDLWLLWPFFFKLRTYCFVIFSLDFYINWLTAHLSTICSMYPTCYHWFLVMILFITPICSSILLLSFPNMKIYSYSLQLIEKLFYLLLGLWKCCQGYSGPYLRI